MAAGTTLAALAQRLGYSPQALSRLMNGNAAVPSNDDVPKAIAKLQAKARNSYAAEVA